VATYERNGLADRPLGELMHRLSDQVSTLVRKEVELAKAELGEKGREGARVAALFAAAAVVGLLALGALTALLILALDGAIPNWAAALIVTVVYAAVAGVLAMIGKRRLDEMGSPAPEQTIESTKEDVQWAKTRLQSARR
jgi:uncharacterized membrane protein YqjE